jgi:exopolyphosphatase/guanosine-5'-triphosphate,3'-diphosphate pyrophosphatase
VIHGDRLSLGSVVGAVDAGSNTIKLSVARPGPNGGIEELATAAETVRLGAGIGMTGVLAVDRMDAAIAALHEFAAIARDHGATRLIGVATEATRRAGNGAAFLRRVRDETGWELTVISGDEEAALTFRGLALEVDLSGTVVVADIGGGSTEVILAESGMIGLARSLTLGSGALTDALVTADPPTGAEVDACIQAARASLVGVPLPSDGPARLIAVGGTGEYLAQLVSNARHLDVAGIEAALAICRTAPSERLAARLGIPPARARVLPAGIAIVRALVDVLRPERVEVARSGIRTGLLLAAFAEMESRRSSTHR